MEKSGLDQQSKFQNAVYNSVLWYRKTESIIKKDKAAKETLSFIIQLSLGAAIKIHGQILKNADVIIDHQIRLTARLSASRNQ